MGLKCSCGESGQRLPCRCVVCSACGTKYARAKLYDAPRRASPLMVPCPNECRDIVPFETIKEWVAADAELAAYLDSVLATVPTKRPTQFDDFNYAYGEDGKLANKITGEGFHFINQAHYDALGDLIVPHIQRLMQEQFGMREVLIPEDASDSEGRGNIFLSSDFETNDRTLLLLIQGSGAVRAGQWARALCINDSLNTGSILPYLREAQRRGWSSVVFNPNQWEDDRELADDPDFDPAVFMTHKKRKSTTTAKRKDIKCSKSAAHHCQHVWREIASKSPARNVLIVAHSAGGPCTLHLLRNCRESLIPRLRGIAFTDSVHHVSRGEEQHVKDVVSEMAVNYVTSDKPLDTLLTDASGGECKRVSAGHTKHEHTSAAAISSVFPFLESQLPPEDRCPSDAASSTSSSA